MFTDDVIDSGALVNDLQKNIFYSTKYKGMSSEKITTDTKQNINSLSQGYSVKALCLLCKEKGLKGFSKLKKSQFDCTFTKIKLLTGRTSSKY